MAAMWSTKPSWCAAGSTASPLGTRSSAQSSIRIDSRAVGPVPSSAMPRMVWSRHVGQLLVDPRLPHLELPVRGVAGHPHDPVVLGRQDLEEARLAVDGQPLEPGAGLRVVGADLDPVGRAGDELVQRARATCGRVVMPRLVLHPCLAPALQPAAVKRLPALQGRCNHLVRRSAGDATDAWPPPTRRQHMTTTTATAEQKNFGSPRRDPHLRARPGRAARHRRQPDRPAHPAARLALVRPRQADRGHRPLRGAALPVPRPGHPPGPDGRRQRVRRGRR